MPKGYDIRPWRPGDEKNILELFQSSFGRSLSHDFWKWRYHDHPHGSPLVMLAWSGDELVAHYGASHAPLMVDGHVLPSALSMTTMTHPDHRGRGLVEAVGEALYETLVADGFCAAWGFPNAMINATRQRKLGWQPICDVPTLSLKTQAAHTKRFNELPKVIKVPEIDARFERLELRLAESGKLRTLRNLETMAWRIDANPVNIYTRYVIEMGDDVVGYAITKNYGDQATDVVALRAIDELHCTALLQAIHLDALAAGIDTMNTWCLNGDAARLPFERFGFNATAPVTYFGGRSFDSTVGDFTDARRWTLSMLDSDLY